MYFWNTRQLALDLREGKVTEQNQMWYLFAYMISTSLSALLFRWIPSEYDMSKIASIVGLGVTIMGILVCYQANSRGDNRDFVVRFVCMNWPVLWRLLAVFLPTGLVLGFVLGMVVPEYGDPIADGFTILAQAVYYALIRRWLIRISITGIEAARVA